MDEKALGKRLQTARKRAGLTQQELCQKAGLSYSTLAKIERGAIRSPSVFTISSIAAATGTTVEGLIGIPGGGGGSPALPNPKKRSKNGVRFVYFDVNGTLVRYYQRAFTEAAQELGVPVDKVETSFWRHNDDMCIAKVSFEEFNAAIASELSVPSFDWHMYYMRNIEAMPGVAELVKWVADNYEVGILSNNMPGFIDELRGKGIIPQADFKAIVDSSKIQAVKPDPKIYEKAVELAAMEPHEILLIDDTRSFLTAADKSGLQIVWFDDMDPEGSIAHAREALAF